MSIEHAGEEGIRWALQEGGIAGAVGLIIGVVLGWPRQTHAPANNFGLSVTIWHNAYMHSTDIAKVVVAGIGGTAVIAVAFGLVGLAFRSIRDSGKPA